MSDELLTALEAMCEEFRGYDLPYGSKAYDHAMTAILAEKERRRNGPDHSIWCVSGHAGEWSDKYEWIVGWMATEAEAMEFKALCQAAGDAAEARRREADEKAWAEYHDGTLDDDGLGARLDEIKAMPANEYDSHFDPSGTFYAVEKVSKAVWKAATK